MATSSTPRDRLRDTVVLACAISAGVHAGLVPAHLHESGRLAGAFAVAAALAALVAAWTALRPRSRRALAAAAVLLLGMIGAYALSRTAGLAPLGGERESLDALGATTQLVEAVGLASAAWLFTTPNSSARRLVARRSIQGGSP
jgi:hypothetical protein